MDDRERLILGIFVILAIIGFIGTLNAINAKISNIAPAPGGVWREGIVGNPHFINPLLAISDPDRDLTSLIYSGLLRPDGKGNLVPDLAERYEISPDGLSYTFYIKDRAEFQDGKPVTADDVLFTINLAKNPDLKSPARANWEGVDLEKVNDKTVRFWLKHPYAELPENMTLGILPQHIWKDVAPEQISLAQFNVKPIGAGPYEAVNVSIAASGVINSYTLEPFYKWTGGAPYISKMILTFYPSEVELINSYLAHEIDALAAISPQNIQKVLRRAGKLEKLTLPKTFAIFFNQNKNNIFVDKSVREAFSLATNKKRIINEVFQNYAEPLSSPIPPGTFGAIEASSSAFDLKAASNILGKNGWKKNPNNGIYEKTDSKKKTTSQLAFSITTSNAPDLVRVANILKENWIALGARVDVKVFEVADLKENVIRPRNYDALLFGEIVSDPFAFWHSSQRNDPGYNIAMYTSSSADKILEEARTLANPEEREKKLELFQQQVIKDNPAIFLYSPYFLYVTPNELKGFNTSHISIPSERFANIASWHFQNVYIWKIFHSK